MGFIYKSGIPNPGLWPTTRGWHIWNWAIRVAGWSTGVWLNLLERQLVAIHVRPSSSLPSAGPLAVPNLGSLGGERGIGLCEWSASVCVRAHAALVWAAGWCASTQFNLHKWQAGTCTTHMAQFQICHSTVVGHGPVVGDPCYKLCSKHK